MADDLLEELLGIRPKLTGKRSHMDPHRVPLLTAAFRRRSHRAPLGGRTKGAGKGTTAGAREPGPLTRRCAVKCHYVSMRAGGQDASRLHLAYVEREGVERDGSPGVLYGGPGFDREVFETALPGEPRQFRFIVSPEDGAELDLHAFAQDLMARMARDLGKKLIWGAVNHHNTEHPHVHLIVRGLDADGRPLRIPAAYVQRQMRWRAQEIATRELGLRTEHDVRRQQSAEVGQERFTSLDRRLIHLGREGSFPARALAVLPKRERAVLRARLETLRRLGLARPSVTGAWHLAPDLQEQLVALGERGDIVTKLHRLTGGAPAQYRLHRMDEVAAAFEGVVRGKGLHDEQSGQLFGAIESFRGEIHYVPLDGPVGAFLQAGDVVRVAPATEPWVKSTDRIVAAWAERHGGMYDPGRHRAELEQSGAERAASAADLVTGNIRRLERLERYKVVARTETGIWRIPPTLLADLQARELSHPRRRLRVEYLGSDLGTQVRHRGPVWLDACALESPAARTGFAAEVAAAVIERRAELGRQGLDPTSATTFASLLAREQADLADKLAAELQLSPVPAAAGFRGGLTPVPPLPSGRGYALIVDAGSGRMVIVPETVATRRLAGRMVEVFRVTSAGADIRAARRLDRGKAT